MSSRYYNQNKYYRGDNKHYHYYKGGNKQNSNYSGDNKYNNDYKNDNKYNNNYQEGNNYSDSYQENEQYQKPWKRQNNYYRNNFGNQKYDNHYNNYDDKHNNYNNNYNNNRYNKFDKYNSNNNYYNYYFRKYGKKFRRYPYYTKEVELDSDKNGINEKFRQELKALGFEIREIKGDGNCLFRCVSDQMENDENNYQVYREKCVEYMKNNKEEFLPFLDEDEKFEDYIETMSKNGEWGGNLEIYALSKALIVNFYIYIHEQEPYTIINWENCDKNILLTYHNGKHYNSLRKIEEEEKKDEKDGENCNKEENEDKNGEKPGEDDKKEQKDGEDAKKEEEKNGEIDKNIKNSEDNKKEEEIKDVNKDTKGSNEIVEEEKKKDENK